MTLVTPGVAARRLGARAAAYLDMFARSAGTRPERNTLKGVPQGMPLNYQGDDQLRLPWPSGNS